MNGKAWYIVQDCPLIPLDDQEALESFSYNGIEFKGVESLYDEPNIKFFETIADLLEAYPHSVTLEEQWFYSETEYKHKVNG